MNNASLFSRILNSEIDLYPFSDSYNIVCSKRSISTWPSKVFIHKYCFNITLQCFLTVLPEMLISSFKHMTAFHIHNVS